MATDRLLPTLDLGLGAMPSPATLHRMLGEPRFPVSVARSLCMLDTPMCEGEPLHADTSLPLLAAPHSAMSVSNVTATLSEAVSACTPVLPPVHSGPPGTADPVCPGDSSAGQAASLDAVAEASQSALGARPSTSVSTEPLAPASVTAVPEPLPTTRVQCAEHAAAEPSVAAAAAAATPVTLSEPAEPVPEPGLDMSAGLPSLGAATIAAKATRDLTPAEAAYLCAHRVLAAEHTHYVLPWIHMAHAGFMPTLQLLTAASPAVAVADEATTLDALEAFVDHHHWAAHIKDALEEAHLYAARHPAEAKDFPARHILKCLNTILDPVGCDSDEAALDSRGIFGCDDAEPRALVHFLYPTAHALHTHPAIHALLHITALLSSALVVLLDNKPDLQAYTYHPPGPVKHAHLLIHALEQAIKDLAAWITQSPALCPARALACVFVDHINALATVCYRDIVSKPHKNDPAHARRPVPARARAIKPDATPHALYNYLVYLVHTQLWAPLKPHIALCNHDLFLQTRYSFATISIAPCFDSPVLLWPVPAPIATAPATKSTKPPAPKRAKTHAAVHQQPGAPLQQQPMAVDPTNDAPAAPAIPKPATALAISLKPASASVPEPMDCQADTDLPPRKPKPKRKLSDDDDDDDDLQFLCELSPTQAKAQSPAAPKPARKHKPTAEAGPGPTDTDTDDDDDDFVQPMSKPKPKPVQSAHIDFESDHCEDCEDSFTVDIINDEILPATKASKEDGPQPIPAKQYEGLNKWILTMLQPYHIHAHCLPGTQCALIMAHDKRTNALFDLRTLNNLQSARLHHRFYDSLYADYDLTAQATVHLNVILCAGALQHTHTLSNSCLNRVVRWAVTCPAPVPDDSYITLMHVQQPFAATALWAHDKSITIKQMARHDALYNKRWITEHPDFPHAASIVRDTLAHVNARDQRALDDKARNVRSKSDPADHYKTLSLFQSDRAVQAVKPKPSRALARYSAPALTSDEQALVSKDAAASMFGALFLQIKASTEASLAIVAQCNERVDQCESRLALSEQRHDSTEARLHTAEAELHSTKRTLVQVLAYLKRNNITLSDDEHEDP